MILVYWTIAVFFLFVGYLAGRVIEDMLKNPNKYFEDLEPKRGNHFIK